MSTTDQSSPRGDGGPLQKLLQNFWAPPLLTLAAGVVGFLVCYLLDHRGASAFIRGFGYPWNLSASSADDLAAACVAVVVTLVSLFFSITLLVLTIAASNLGVRLIDRWIERATFRSTLSVLLAWLTFALLTLAAIDPDQGSELVPRLTLLVLLIGLISTFGWLAYSFDRLARAIHVDTSVARLGDDLAEAFRRRREQRLDDDYVSSPGDGAATREVPARISGYLNEIDPAALRRFASDHGCVVTLTLRPGGYVLAGRPLAHLTATASDAPVALDRAADQLHDHLPLGAFRSNHRHPDFSLNLLVEIAARALSPAVNDLYTALACVDALAHGLHAALVPDADADPFADPPAGPGVATVRLPDDRWHATAAASFGVLRRAAASYPLVATRIIDRFGALHRLAGSAEDRDALERLAREARDDAIDGASSELDREALRAAFDDAFAK